METLALFTIPTGRLLAESCRLLGDLSNHEGTYQALQHQSANAARLARMTLQA